jgi:hypothetical protein
MMLDDRQLPDANRLSVLIATILLAYALTRVIALPPYTLLASLFGREFGIHLNASLLAPFLTAGLMATGMDWLLRNHPHLDPQSRTEHLVLPALTAWVAGIFIYSLADSPGWWVAFALATLLLVGIIYAEYIAVEANDIRYGLASALLTGLAFILFLLVAIALRTVGVRLFILVPVLFMAAWLVTLRTLHLRLGGRWKFGWATGIALALTQFAAALHYLPLTPLEYGLLVLAPAYALAALAANLLEELPLRSAITEPLITLVIVWGLALVI